MDLQLFIGRTKFFACARARIYRSALVLSFCIVYPILSSAAPEPQFILGQDSRIHGILLDHTQEAATRKKLGISDKCRYIKTNATAASLLGLEGSSVDPHIQSTRGIVVLEGVVNETQFKILHTALLSPYKNYPTVIFGETDKQASSRYPLTVTLAATLAGEGNLTLHKSDSLVIHAGGQLYSYPLTDITIPNEGVLRLYAGTDDKLYYDAALKHPLHAGPCGCKK